MNTDEHDQGIRRFSQAVRSHWPGIAVIIGGKLNELMPLLFQPALKAANVDDIRKFSYNGILYGKVVGSLVDFLIVALFVFLIAKWFLKEAVVTRR